MDEEQKKQVEEIVDKKLSAQRDSLNQDLKKFMYDKVYEELKLNREWPIKVSAFTSAVYLGVISLANSEAGREIISTQWSAILLFAVLIIFAGLGIWNIYNRHVNYLKCRDIQIGFQKSWGIENWRDKEKLPEQLEQKPGGTDVTNETIQAARNAGSNTIFPPDWSTREIPEPGKTPKSPLKKNSSGLLFYEGYLVTTFIITAIIIWNNPKKPIADLQSLKDIRTQDSTIRSALINILQSKEKLSVDVDTVIIKSVPAPKSPVKKKQPAGKKRN